MLNKIQIEINAAIEAVWPWLEKTDSQGGSWTWTASDSRDRGYGKEDEDLVGCVGFEDAVFLFDERDEACMYTAMEYLQEEIERRGLPYWLEPHYSFLWLIHQNDGRRSHEAP